MQINIYMRQAITEALGPGKRYALWVQGCMRRCKGCISPDSRSFDKGDWMDVTMLAEEIIHTDAIEGITISGGEPFLQAEALCELLAYIKSRKDYGVMIYTGNTYEQLLQSADISIQRLLSFTDILIDGEYIEELNDGKSLRGSSNQRVLFLTGRYEGNREIFGKAGRDVELYIRNDRVRMVGIPSKEILDRLGLKKEYPDEREKRYGGANHQKVGNGIVSELKRLQESSQKADEKKTAMEELDGLVGCDEIKKYIKKLAFRLRLENDGFIKLNCLITGNPGTGKTTVARILSRIYKEMGLLKSGHMAEVMAGSLIADDVGQTAANVREKVMEAMDGVLFIDDVHGLIEEKYGLFEKEALGELIRCMLDYQGRFAVMVAGYPIAMEALWKTDQGFVMHCFANRFHMGDYTPDELHQIFERIMAKKHLRLDEELNEMLPAFFEKFIRTRGNQTDCRVWGNAREVESLADEIGKRCICSEGRIIQEEGRHIGIVSKEHFTERLQSLLCPACVEEAAGMQARN